MRPSFAFIVHPRNERDMFRADRLSLLREISADDDDFVARVRKLPPTIVGEVLFGFSPFRGILIGVGCLPDEILTRRGRAEIVRAVQLALDTGVDVIGLGALTAPATRGGVTLLDHLPDGVTITNGNAYTVAVLVDDVLEAVAKRALDHDARVAIVGCTGSVGTAVAGMLHDARIQLVLIGRSAHKAERMLRARVPTAHFSGQVRDAAMADVVLVVTSDPSARLALHDLREGTFVIDAAEPKSVPEQDVRDCSGRVTVCRGGRVRIQGYGSTYDLGLDDPDETYACLAETYLFTCDGIRENSVGPVEPELARRLRRTAARHGVERAGLGAGEGEARARELVHPR